MNLKLIGCLSKLNVFCLVYTFLAFLSKICFSQCERSKITWDYATGSLTGVMYHWPMELWELELEFRYNDWLSAVSFEFWRQFSFHSPQVVLNFTFCLVTLKSGKRAKNMTDENSYTSGGIMVSKPSWVSSILIRCSINTAFYHM